MESMQCQQSVKSKSASKLSTLKGALQQREITALVPEWGPLKSGKKLEQITHSLLPVTAREITEEEFSSWEKAELRRMCKNDRVEDRPRFRFWERLHKQSLLGRPGDAPVIRFWRTLRAGASIPVYDGCGYL
jgi:hypothetical protein